MDEGTAQTRFCQGFVQSPYNDSVSITPESLRIGEFARRVGVNAALLRAWERRYGLLQPVRSPGGFRLYTNADAERVARMRRGLDEGLSAAEAARAALQSARPLDGLLEDAASRLVAAIHDYDEAAVHAILDQSLAAFGLEPVLRDLILPTLRRVGVEWRQGTLAISQEHFASNLIRGRLLSLARMWGRGSGPLALLACAPGEQHDITLLAFGLLLRSYGWRILFLGADTPISTLTQTTKTTRPTIAVLASFDPALLQAEATALRRLAKMAPLVLSGPGASDTLCNQLSVRRLNGDVITAANEIARRPNG
jgi:MerR family transcriptional regulator, light-induced transcriptional regulator